MLGEEAFQLFTRAEFDASETFPSLGGNRRQGPKVRLRRWVGQHVEDIAAAPELICRKRGRGAPWRCD